MSEASAFGAVSVLNATATGVGCSLAIEDGVRARWKWLDEGGLRWAQRDVDAALVAACFENLRSRFGLPDGADAGTSATWPAARGLKTSSSAAAALLRAAVADASIDIDPPDLVSMAVAANVAAGTTITGAFDDQVATVRGGCHITDNAERRIEATLRPERWHVAVWVPEAKIEKRHVAHIDASVLAKEARAAEALARMGDIAAALTANGDAFTRLYAAAGLPVTSEPASVARQAGALGAGLSGTGPSVAALFDAPAELDAVAGGTWRWSRVQEDTWT